MTTGSGEISKTLATVGALIPILFNHPLSFFGFPLLTTTKKHKKQNVASKKGRGSSGAGHRSVASDIVIGSLKIDLSRGLERNSLFQVALTGFGLVDWWLGGLLVWIGVLVVGGGFSHLHSAKKQGLPSHQLRVA